MLLVSTVMVLALVATATANTSLKAQMKGRAHLNSQSGKNPMLKLLMSNKNIGKIKTSLAAKRGNGLRPDVQAVTGSAETAPAPTDATAPETAATDATASETAPADATTPGATGPAETAATDATATETAPADATTPGATGPVKNPIDINVDQRSPDFQAFQEREIQHRTDLQDFVKKGDDIQEAEELQGQKFEEEAMELAQKNTAMKSVVQHQLELTKKCKEKGAKCKKHQRLCDKETETEIVTKKKTECCVAEFKCEPKSRLYTFDIMGVEVDHVISYEMRDYSKDRRILLRESQSKKIVTVAEAFDKKVNFLMKDLGFTEATAATSECLKLNLVEAKSTVTQLAKALNLEHELERQCPYYHHLSRNWKSDGVDPIFYQIRYRGGTVGDSEEKRLMRPLGFKSYKPPNPSPKCQGDDPDASEGAMVKCLLCALKDIVQRRRKSGNAAGMTQIKLHNFMLDMEKDYSRYQMCSEKALQCSVPPRFLGFNKWIPGYECTYRDVGVAKTCPISTIVHFHKALHTVDRHRNSEMSESLTVNREHSADYCSRLNRLDTWQYELFDFLKGAEFDKESNMCEIPKHMDLMKANGVDFAIDVRRIDADTSDVETLQFEIDSDPYTGEKFLAPEDITWDAKTFTLNVVYDCREKGAGFMRCHYSLAKGECDTEVTTNFVRVYDGNRNFVERCAVTVKGLKFSIICDGEKDNEDDVGDRRRKFIAMRDHRILSASQSLGIYGTIKAKRRRGRSSTRRRLLAKSGVNESGS